MNVFPTQTNAMIPDLDPFTYYSVIVQAVGDGGLDGQLNEVVNRTHTATDSPPITDPTATTDTGRNTFLLTLPDPDQIDTGPVMYVITIHNEDID